ncbi:hypothetical protein OMB55_00004900 [gamma proteobacterium HIMB55]|nr:hypothetical protein OMB55_00004900 [gamma proteobacterium HIMB55]
MDRSFILKNQDGHYWGRSKEWVDGSDRSRVAQYKHRDEASNTVFELSSKDFGLRAEILEMTLKEGKLPKLSISQIPLPGLEEEKEEKNEEAVEENDARASKSINDDAVPSDSSDEESAPKSTDEFAEESTGETPDEDH